MKLIGIEKTEFELSHETWLKINNLVLDLTRSAGLDELRRLFLERVSELIPHKKSFFDLGCTKEGNADFFDAISLNMTDNELEAYYKNYQASDYVAWMLPGDAPVYYRDSLIISKELREKSSFYQQWLEPMGVYYSIGSTLFDDGVLYGSITLFNDYENDFTDENVFILRIISEHLTAILKSMYPGGFKKGTNHNSSNELIGKYGLTNRESEIAELIGKGLSNREIADLLCISESTVKKHNNTVFTKLKVRTRTQLIKLLDSGDNF